MSNYLSILTANIDNSSKSSIVLKISGKGLNDTSNVFNTYDNNGIGFQLTSNTSNYKEFDIINTSNNSSLQISITNPSVNIKTSNINKPLIINNNLTIINSNIGIGITNPQTAIHIKGNMTLNGNFIKSTGSNYNSNNTQWSNIIGNDNIYYNLGNVGIGTTNPQSLIQLSSSQSFIQINNNFIVGKDSNQNGLLWNYDNSNLIFGNSNRERLRINNGNIGFGTTNSLASLDIRGDIIIYGSINNNDLKNVSYWSNVNGNVNTNNNIYYNLGNIGIGTSNPQSIIQLLAPQSFVTINNNFIVGKDSNQNGLLWNYDNANLIIGTSNQEQIRISNGNIGIGTTNPLSSLDIRGNLFFNGTINNNDSRYINLWSNANANGNVNNNLYYNLGNIGVGTTNPQSLVQLSASQSFVTVNENFIVGKDNNQSGLLWNYDNANLILGTSNKEHIRISNGNIGIGTTNPLSSLDIRGNLFFNGTINNNDSRYINLWSNANTNSNLYYNLGNIGIGITNPQSFVQLSASQSFIQTNNFIIGKDSNQNGLIWNYDNCNLLLGTSNQERLRITSNGNIGIGTTKPLFTLDIKSNVNISGILTVNNTLIRPFIVNSNIFYNKNQELNISNYNLNNYNLPNHSNNSNLRLYSNAIPSTSYSYILITSNISIIISNPITTDLLLVGAGANGEIGPFTGGGGAGEVIPYNNYQFNNGTYIFNVGISTDNPTTSISDTNNNSLITAYGGGGAVIFEDYGNYNVIYSGTNNTFNDVVNSSDNSYVYFINNGTIKFKYDTTCTVFMIGGGAGGGTGNPYSIGGGGGAGAYYLGQYTFLAKKVYNIFIGGGGDSGGNGGDTYITLDTDNTKLLWVFGGGSGGGGYYTNGSGNSGGCGGGGSCYNQNNSGNGGNAINTGTNGIGNNGGNSIGTNGSSVFYCGGGGGIGGSGTNGNSSTPGIGGNGLIINIKGMIEVYGGGGGGADRYGGGDGIGGGIGSIIVGGNGKSSYGETGDSAVANTGSGGGGAGYNGSGGNGSSGVIILRFTKNNKQFIIGGSGNGGTGGSSITSGIIAGQSNSIYSLLTDGKIGISAKGGDGGSALTSGRYTSTITGTNITVGLGGIGATASFIASNGTYYGDGGSGNGGIGANGVIIMRYPTSSNNYLKIINNIPNTNYSYLQITSNTTIQINNPIYADLLLVGAGGNGGIGPYSGGGGAGEVIYYPNFPFMTGNYTFNVGQSLKNTKSSSQIIKAINGDTSAILTSNDYYLFNTKKPYACYFAEDFSGTTFYDSSGNNRHGTSTGTINKVTLSGYGATASITYLTGNTSAYIIFPSGSIPTTFTILSLSRFTGGTNGRIVQAQNGNWLHGHYINIRGVCHYDVWKTPPITIGTLTDWLCCIGKNSGIIPNNILIDGEGYGNATGGTGNYTLSINKHISFNEPSDWAVSCIIVWDQILTDQEMINLNSLVNNYKLTNYFYSFNSSNNITKIIKNNTDLIVANNGGNGGYITNFINNSSNVYNSTTYKYISFINSGTITLKSSIICDILIVGGGGAGGQSGGGGGGAGGLIYLSNQTISSGTYNVVVGAGGTASSASDNTMKGGDSSFNGVIAYGGGGGEHMGDAGSATALSYTNGGSGGGGERRSHSDTSIAGRDGGSGVSGQGNNGGQGKNASGLSAAGGGGGGAGSAGGSAFTAGRGGNGGIGSQISITGTNTYYAGGGGGGSGSDFSVAGTGGSGGGGNGAISNNVGNNGTNGLGGGGGGGAAISGAGQIGGSGGSGIVIIRYNTIYDIIQPTSGGSGGGEYYMGTYTYLTITNNYNITLYQNTIIKYNYGNFVSIPNIMYNITFTNGSIIVGSLAIDKSYPILKDGDGNNINPILWYRFDDNATLMLNDSSNNYNLTNNGAVYDNTNFIKGSGSIYFNNNGTNDKYVSFTGINLNQINTTANRGISFSLWVKLNTSSYAYSRIFAFGEGSTSSISTANFSKGIVIKQNSNDYKLGCFITGSTGYISSTTYFDNNWHHIVWTISPSGFWNIYIDNINVYSVQEVVIPVLTTNVFNLIGRDIISGSTTYGFNGNIDDFRIYDFILSSVQVSELYKGRVEIIQTRQNILAGIPNNENYSLITSGSLGILNQGGSGGSALPTGRFLTTITGSSLYVGLGGIGSTASSIASNGINFGDGGSGNGGLGAQGVIIMRFPTTANKYLTISNNSTEINNLRVSGNIYTSPIDTFDINLKTNYNINIKPNLWCRFETGAITTNNGIDTITLTNNGSATNAGVSVRGNNSLNLNGSSQYLTGTLTNISNNSFSVSAWLYSKTGATSKGIVLTIGTVYTNYQTIIIGFGINNLNTYGFLFYASDAYSSSTFVNDINIWVHITWVYDSLTKERMIYRNGIKLDLVNAISPSQATPNTNIVIGSLSSSYYYNGYIDDLRIYTGKVLTQEEINAIYNDTSIANYTIFDNYWTKSSINTNDIYYNQGNIGIGTVRPQSKLDTIDDINITGNYYSNGIVISYSSTSNLIFSDSRIKTNINDINDDGALQQILKIEPKIYNYIDKGERGNDTVYGFIAQQIREVIPQAVKVETDFIPNIYKWFDYDCNNNQIITNEDLTTILGIGDRIKIKDNNQNYYRTATIINITTTAINIDLPIYCNQCFIYGKEIHDFHFLDKSYIYTLGVCATQELYKIMKDLNDKYEQQQIKIKTIKELLNQ